MSEEKQTGRKRRSLLFVGLVALAVGATILGLALLVNIFQRKQEARNPFYRVVELTDDTIDPSVWGKNFPLQYDDYKKTTDEVRTRYGGSEAEPRTPTQADPRSIVAQSRLEEDPRLKIMWAGYAFSKDFREERGHAYMLDDQMFTERQQVAKQPAQQPRIALDRGGFAALLLGRRRVRRTRPRAAARRRHDRFERAAA